MLFAHAPSSFDMRQSWDCLHPVVLADDLVAVGATVGHILAAVDAEWDEAAAQITPIVESNNVSQNGQITPIVKSKNVS